jgi:sugar lactone lactonase YvrE
MSPSKKTNKRINKKTNVSRKQAVLQETTLSSGVAVKNNKSMVRILIAVVALVCIFEALSLSHNGQTLKDFKVNQMVKVVGEDTPSGHFNSWGIAPIGKDKFIVCDQQNGRLLIFDRLGHFLKGVCKRGSGPMNLNEPSGMTADNNGNAYVIDTWNGAIKGFNETGKEVLNLDLTKLNNFYGPRGLGFDGQNFIIADTGSHRVALVSPHGSLVSLWGRHGTGKNEFDSPMDVASDQKGNYYVADTGNSRLQFLNPDGKTIKVIKFKGGASAVAVDREGRIYVANGNGGGCVEAFSAQGAYLGDLRDQNGSSEAFQGVRGMAISADDVLMVTINNFAYLFKLPPQ